MAQNKSPNQQQYLEVEIAYANTTHQYISRCLVSPGQTILDVIVQSKILEKFPEIDLQQQAVGVFCKVCDLNTIVSDGDRIEIYRPLTIDPKEARRKKAQHFTKRRN